ncbi:hypothetical protein GCM10020221_05730 [Streptomyces thioluteus]|uniref:Alpha-amylase n=1 Tax=Streptomyces thioluteus TaxID=66431 RepID=A0ABN3WFI0_STRTU
MSGAARRVVSAVLLLLAGCLLWSPPRATAAPPGQRDVTAVLFQWRYDSVARECAASLGPAGYGSVQVSPPQEHIAGPQWWTSYQPVGYRIAGRLGDRAAFARMTSACHRAGVRVVVDAVLNHMSAGAGTGTGGSAHTKYDYPGTYRDADFHRCRRPITDYRNRDDVQNCELLGLADLDTASPYVRERLARYLDDLLALGADGFRIDGAKHIASADLAAVKARTTRPGAYWKQEVIFGAVRRSAPRSTWTPATSRNSATPATCGAPWSPDTSRNCGTSARGGAICRAAGPPSSSTTGIPSGTAAPSAGHPVPPTHWPTSSCWPGRTAHRTSTPDTPSTTGTRVLPRVGW